MFQQQKRDYFSVNNDIAIKANQQQREYEVMMMIAAIKSDKAGFGDEQASYTQEQAEYEED